MTTESKLQTDSRETPDPADKDGEKVAVSTTHPNLELEEEKAARLGDFA